MQTNVIIGFCLWLFAAYGQAASVTIIIDDLGNNPKLGIKAINLPGNLVIGILPGTPYATMLAEMAHSRGHEIMLHVPMQSEHDKALGPDALQLQMSEFEFKQILEHAIKEIPHARGMNNHMGSLLTTHQLPMQWIMEVLKPHKLYFVDSRTTVETVAQDLAERNGIPNLRRDVFLDNEKEFSAIEKQFNQLLKLAKKRGFATGIAHPYPETLAALQILLPRLEQNGIKMVTLSSKLLGSK